MNFFKTFIILVSLFLLTFSLKADERPFPYTYTTNVLKKNARDFEVHTNFRVRRKNFYSSMENRLEYEVGVTDKLQASFYVNFKNTTTENSLLNTYDTEFEFGGVSTEWIYQVSNKYTSFIGFAPYVELTLNTREVGFETKLLFDKKLGRDFTLALNFNAEYEWGFNPLPEKTEKNLALEVFFGGSYQASKYFSFGFEGANINTLPDGNGLQSSSLFLGPNLSYHADNWYATITWLHQLPALKKSENLPTSNLILDNQERNNVKLLLSFSL